MQYSVVDMLPMMNFLRFFSVALCGVWFVSCGVNRNAQPHQAVTFAFGEWKSADVGRLIEEGAEVNTCDARGCSPLLNAYGIGCDVFEDDPHHEEAIASIKLLLAAGADVCARTPQGHNALDLALRYYDNEPIVKFLRAQGLRATNPEYELVWHAMHNHVAEVKRLLAAGVSPNAHSVDGCSALCFNAKPHSAACMDILLAAGADVKELRDGYSLPDLAMIFSGEEMAPRYLQLLLQHGAVFVRPPCRH